MALKKAPRKKVTKAAPVRSAPPARRYVGKVEAVLHQHDKSKVLHVRVYGETPAQGATVVLTDG